MKTYENCVSRIYLLLTFTILLQKQQQNNLKSTIMTMYVYGCKKLYIKNKRVSFSFNKHISHSHTHTFKTKDLRDKHDERTNNNKTSNNTVVTIKSTIYRIYFLRKIM